MRGWFLVLSLMAMIAVPAGAEIQGMRATLTPYIGATSWTDSYLLNNALLVGGRLGFYPTPWAGVEGTLGFSSTETSFSPNYPTDMTHYGIDAIVNFRPKKGINPYVLGGWTQLTYDSSEDNTETGGTPYINKGFEIGAGVNFRVYQSRGFQTDIRLEARNAIAKLQPWFPDHDGLHSNWLFTVGVQLALGSTGGDRDGDGVKDSRDHCPDTPSGATVDSRGCPFDTDGDGIPDGIDESPHTLFFVDVDEFGRPHDPDGDGIPDGLDECADTPPHLAVDVRGCPIEVTVYETHALDRATIHFAHVQFDYNQADIKPEYYPILDQIGAMLMEWPDLRLEIGGHADATGKGVYNRELSERRAAAVLWYLHRNFPDIQGSRLRLRALGESLPYKTNETREGREENRRVEFKVIQDPVEKQTERKEYQRKDSD